MDIITGFEPVVVGSSPAEGTKENKMKKIFRVFFVSLAFLFLGFSQILAAECGPNGDPSATGLVPCGISCECTITNFFVMLTNIYDFIVWWIAAPLAILALTIGGIFILISAGNPNLQGTGKKIVYAAIIGLVLVFCSWIIIDFILKAVGYAGNWSNPFS